MGGSAHAKMPLPKRILSARISLWPDAFDDLREAPKGMNTAQNKASCEKGLDISLPHCLKLNTALWLLQDSAILLMHHIPPYTDSPSPVRDVIVE